MLNDFGKTIRKARIDTGETLSSMSKGIKKTVSFLSAIETGVKKIPMGLVPVIRDYLISKGANFEDLANLEEDAILANGQMSLEGLDINTQKTVAKFAKTNLTQEQIDAITKILE
ncbi:transcriptional regulator [Kingella kingae]|uniref:XRE family transcriptional regulator n=2 Tax=Kingella kingae TaxID=504 RepID=F5S9D1_KINKI|nr:transcriptional regulator [Kingella kingae]EGK07401.1 XRE family transcriptional regulator [Kingella kingae ATCC 23330]MDK4528466.1 transcriptional regulator [Kingella kingae]MDK4530744.1 transcriptional regulator [Kingella kingae]MDK4534732.1 transcriptional regulator [Kingella kingae]MDK4541193.1 transcriptional regulator [Kingella kingae]